VIAHLRGKLAQKDSARVVVDVNGVGYEVFVPLTTFTALPATGSDVSIDIHTHVREDIIALYGFSTRRERTIFEKIDDDLRDRTQTGGHDSFGRFR